jgi:hypothetical protein
VTGAARTVTEVTDFAGVAPEARALILRVLGERWRDPEAPPLDLDFHRGWNGGWRCRAIVGDRHRLEFALLRTPDGALLALPVPMPEPWRTGSGVPAADGTRWTQDDEGAVVAVRGHA